MEGSHNHQYSVELDQCLVWQLSIPDVHLYHFFTIFGVYYHLRRCILLIYNSNDGIKPLLQLKRGVKKSFISPSLSPAIWMIVFFIIDTSQSKQVPSIRIFIRSESLADSSLVPSDIPGTCITHMLFT